MDNGQGNPDANSVYADAARVITETMKDRHRQEFRRDMWRSAKFILIWYPILMVLVGLIFGEWLDVLITAVFFAAWFLFGDATALLRKNYLWVTSRLKYGLVVITGLSLLAVGYNVVHYTFLSNKPFWWWIAPVSIGVAYLTVLIIYLVPAGRRWLRVTNTL